MRIAYVCVYQGEELLRKRRIRRGRTLAGSQKSRLVAETLAAAGNDVLMVSEAIPAERTMRFYPSFSETMDGPFKIPVVYAAGLDMKLLNNIVPRISIPIILWKEHRRKRIDAVIVYDFSVFQVLYGMFARFVLGVPVFIEYEDDAMVTREGAIDWFNRLCKIAGGFFRRYVSGCIAVTPELLAQFPGAGHMLLRGIVGRDLMDAARSKRFTKEKIVLYSGSLFSNKGADLAVEAWKNGPVDGWQLHVTGTGPLASWVEEISRTCPSLVYHGVVPREKMVELLCAATICVNPHRSSAVPGNVFPFKVVEYLAAGAHVVSTRMGMFERELEQGITYMDVDSVECLVETMHRVIRDRLYSHTAADYVWNEYGFDAVSEKLGKFVARETGKREMDVKSGHDSRS
jgi:glycosyltransferase involved in cell wall biosynthesis